jgi:hypothetical protein
LLTAVRNDAPGEPFWRGVRRVAVDGNGVDVEWHEPVTPRLRPLGAVEVECHLYDEDALVESEARRSVTSTAGGEFPPAVPAD